MNGILIIKKDHGMNPFDHAAMQNTIGICDCVLTDKSDGDEVEVKIKGTLMEHDGKRYISVDEVDGEPVEDTEMDHNPDEGMEEDASSMDSEDALMNYLNKNQEK